MLHDPLHLFDSNAFYPHPLSLAFSDSLLGYGPGAFIGSGTVAALVRYNLLFLWAWSLCFLGAYLLARELGLRGSAAPPRAGVRLRALPRHRGRPPARDLLRRHTAGAVPAAARLPATAHAARARGLARVRLAGQPRLHAGPAVLLPARRARPGGPLPVVARRASRGTRKGPGPFGAPTGSPAAPARARAGALAARWSPERSGGDGDRDRADGAVAVYQARPYLRVAAITRPRSARSRKSRTTPPARPRCSSASSENRVWGSATSGARAHVHSKNEDVFFPGGRSSYCAAAGLAARCLHAPHVRIGLRWGSSSARCSRWASA